MTTNEMMFKAGYCKAPNNIWGLPGNEWYAMGPNTPTVKHNEEIRLIDGEISIWTTRYYERPDGSHFMFHISGVVEHISTLEDLKQYCLEHGRISEPGLSAYMWGD